MGEHYLMRPRGLDWTSPDQPEIPGALAAWRQAFRRMDPPRQVLATSILQLYLSRKDTVWQVGIRQPHAVDAIQTLRDADLLTEWGSLFIHYPGW